jgi:NTE family protein
MAASTLKISLALQGGGTHGAFAWGTTDQLLLDERVDISAISATSGGAMMAVVLAQGMLENGREGAREALQSFWKKVSIASALLPLKMSAVDKFLANVGIDISPSTMALDYVTRVFSPYQFNLFDINPLRGIIDEMVDFRALHKKSPLPFYINATHAKTGERKIFDHTDVSLDAVMASSCLPYIFKTVMIDGEPYWDGSLSGCPPLAPLVENKHAGDIVLVQVHPRLIEDVPTASTDILDRMTEIGFNAVLDQEIKTIEQQKKSIRIHRVEADETLVSLGRASKLNADWDFLVHLHDLGVQAATDWLDKIYSSAARARG